MSIKRKFLVFETLTVALNLLFATLTISLILEDRTQTHLSSKITKAKEDFVNSLDNINTNIHQSVMNYLIEEENTANFEFLITNQEFQTSGSKSLTSLYYRIIKKVTRSLHSHSISNSLDRLYLFDQHNRLVTTINNEKQQVYYLRHNAETYTRVDYADQLWSEQQAPASIDTNIEKLLPAHASGHTSSYTVINNALYFKSVTPVRYAERNIFWLITLRRVPPATIKDISNHLEVKILLSHQGNPLLNSSLKLNPEQLHTNNQDYWVQEIENNEYYFAAHQFNHDTELAPASAFIAYSSESIQQQNNNVIYSTATYLIIIGFFTLLILNYLISKVIVLPIYQLKQKAHEIAKGDLDTNITIKGTDEIAAFASDLTQLRDSIKTKIDQLYNAQNTLEHTVQERTKALNIKTTEAVESLNQLKQTQAKLVELKKVERLGTVVAGVAHNMNTPVGVVITANSHLKDQISELQATIKANELTKRRLESFIDFGTESTTLIENNIKQAAELINNFKDIAVNKSETIKSHFNLLATLTEIINSFQSQLDKNHIQVQLNCPAKLNLLSVKNVFTLMMEVFIDNSLTHGFKQQETGQISIVVEIEKSRIKIIYGDNGKGVPAEKISHIFDPFYTEDLALGTGLGLSVLYNNIVHVLDGTISCNSELNHGLSFEVIIPNQSTS